MTQRITFSMDDELMHDLDRIISERGYASRSEAIRDVARAGLMQAAEDNRGAGCGAAILTYVYKHSTRDIPRRLTRTFHAYASLSVSILRLHLEGERCLEVNVLRGEYSSIKRLADRVITDPGVHYGRLMMVPSERPKRTRKAPRSTARWIEVGANRSKREIERSRRT